MLIVDAHEDLAWNMVTFGRNYSRSARETRQNEIHTATPRHNGDSLLGWPDYQRGDVALVFATLFAAPVRRKDGGWDTQCYTTTLEARQLYRKQLDLYCQLVEKSPDKFSLVKAQEDLQLLLEKWQDNNVEDDGHPVGLVILMEGAEGIADFAELDIWWEQGLRIIGPAWAGNRFCGGTREPGPLTKDGAALLDAMAERGFILDLSHMDEQAVLQALDRYPGVLAASHANALSLLKNSNSNRHLSDRVIRGIIARDGVIGIVPMNAFLVAGWQRGDRREAASLDHVIAQIDYICQMAGDARHAGLGSDFDGGFGLQAVPPGIDSVADLQKIGQLLQERGYSGTDVAAILGENWLGLLKRGLPGV